MMRSLWVVLALAALPLMLAAGDLNVKVYKTSLSISHADIQWLSSSTGFALDKDGTVIHTTQDAGRTWISKVLFPGEIITGIYPQYASNGTTAVFLGQAEGTTYITTDGGKTINLDPSQVNATYIEFHPTNKQWAIAVNRPSRDRQGTAYATLNFLEGLSTIWTPIHTAVWEVTWCSPNAQDPRLCMIYDLSKSPRVMCTTVDFGTNCVFPLQSRPVYRMFETQRFFVALSSNSTLFTSWDNLRTFHAAISPANLLLPVNDPSQFLDTRTAALWVAATPGPTTYGTSQNGNVFVSDWEGYKFIDNLRNIHSLNNNFDFTRVESLNGTFIANVMIPFSNTGTFVNPVDNSTLLKTRITYDYGVTWSYLTAPEVDHEGYPITCSGICSLNLFGRTSWWSNSQIYSKESAVGVIVGTGNVGDFLSYDPHRIYTFISNDGGRRWWQVLEGSWDYSYGQSSGILVMVKPGEDSNTFHWSLDEGATLHSQVFSEVNLTVFRIYSFDPSGNVFLIDAIQNGELVLIALDFSSVFERTCASSDFYVWRPTDLEGNSTCLNGKIDTYSRRRWNANCTSTIDGTIYKTDYCACGRGDYECDFDYFLMLNGSCFGSPVVDCEPGQSKYYRSQGYRRTAENACNVNNPKYDPILTPCPVFPTTTATISSTTNDLSLSSSTRFSATGTTGELIIKEGISSQATAVWIILIAIAVGIFAFIAGVVAAFRSHTVRKAIPKEWKAKSGSAEQSYLL